MNHSSPTTEGRRLSFLELFGKDSGFQCVEIPLIQRDYAQGRASAKGIRTGFLTHLFNALKENKPLSLDFVYGEVVEEGRRFQPIDGQQRLTTLFLLHWFLACAENSLTDFRNQLRKDGGEPRFLYTVRPSSERFFAELLNYQPDNLEVDLRNDIIDQPWFFQAWLHDATIDGALTMIEAIRQCFGPVAEADGLYGKLAAPGCNLITMDVLNLGSLGLSEAIYIKMNARGKELTGFEKFKAWLIGEHNDFEWPAGSPPEGSWKLLLDGAWLDLFWFNHLGEKNLAADVSRVFFRTFAALAVNFHASREGFKSEVLEDWLTADSTGEEKVWARLFTSECLDHVFKSLQALARPKEARGWPLKELRARLVAGGVKPFDEPELGAAFMEGTGQEPTLEMRLWLHAIGVFFRQQMRVGGREELHWFRVVRNLLEHSTVRSHTFSNALQSLDKLGRRAAACGSVLKALEEEVSLTGLNADQLKEERRKARLIGLPKSDDDWEATIIKAEAHPVLCGQIELLLPEADDFVRFSKRWEIFEKLLNENGSTLVALNEYLLIRAIFARSEAIKLYPGNEIRLSDSLVNWRSLLGRNFGLRQLREGTVALLDSLIGSDMDLVPALTASLQPPRTSEPWMLDIIQYGDVLLRNSTTQKIKYYYWHGLFSFYQTNWSEKDVLIGTAGTHRNALICNLTEGLGAEWELVRKEDRLEIPVDGHPSKLFFRDHYVQLTSRIPELAGIACSIEYDRIVVSGSGMKTEQVIPGFDSVAEAELRRILLEIPANPSPSGTGETSLPEAD